MEIEVLAPRARERIGRLDRIWEERPGLIGWLTTVDHKRIGLLYFFTTLAFFAAGGVEALLMRTQLASPNSHVLSPEAYDQVMTMHGITKKKIIVTPCVLISWSNASGPTTWRFGPTSCVRTTSASTPPAPKNTSVVNR